MSSSTFGGVERTFTIDGLTESINDSTEKLHTDRDVDDVSGSKNQRGWIGQLLVTEINQSSSVFPNSPLDTVTLFDTPIVTKDTDTDIVGFQVQAHASDTRREFNHLFSCESEV